jgi:hypothetical protein
VSDALTSPPLLTALIVWDNGESYDCSATYCIAVDPAELEDAVRLLRLDWKGSVIAYARDVVWSREPTSLDEILTNDVAFNICVSWDEGRSARNLASLKEFSPAIRERVAKALLADRGYHEDHKPAIKEIVEKVLRR